MLGEALFNRMLVDLHDHREQHLVASMLQLETETKARLRQAAAERRLPVVEDESQRAAGAEIGASLSTLTWLDKMRRLETGIRGTFLPRYEEVAATAPGDDHAITEYMVTHETALLHAVQCAINSDGDSAVAAIDAHLHFPLPRPTLPPRTS